MRKTFGIMIAIMGVLALTPSGAWAGDNIQVTVTGSQSGPQPAIKVNGNQAISGTVQLFYVVDGYNFPEGDFATFTVRFNNGRLNGPTNAVYPAQLTLEQIGSAFLALTPSQSAFEVTGTAWSDEVEVQIAIDDGAPSADGTDLVGNLRLMIPGANKVGTPTNIQVHVRLAHPTSCLNVFHFMTDSEMTSIHDSMTVSVNANKGWVSSTSPSQASDNVLIANSCAWNESFDLRIVLDPRFQTSPNGNPGNAVHTYNSGGVVSQSSFNMALFGPGTGQGQNLCLQNVHVPAGASFLAAVHSSMIHHLPAASLGVYPLTFVASLTQAGYGCSGGVAAFAAEGAVTLQIPFTVN